MYVYVYTNKYMYSGVSLSCEYEYYSYAVYVYVYANGREGCAAVNATRPITFARAPRRSMSSSAKSRLVRPALRLGTGTCRLARRLSARISLALVRSLLGDLSPFRSSRLLSSRLLLSSLHFFSALLCVVPRFVRPEVRDGGRMRRGGAFPRERSPPVARVHTPLAAVSPSQSSRVESATAHVRRCVRSLSSPQTVSEMK